MLGVDFGRRLILQFAVEEIGKIVGDGLVVAALDLWTLAADLAHVVEEQRLHLVVLGFLGAFEQGVIDLAEYTAQMLRQSVHHQFAAGLYQIAEARLYTAAGEANHLGMNGGLVLVAHGLS